MGRKEIFKNSAILNYLLNEREPITERLAKYNEYECLAFVMNSECLPSGFSNLFKDNHLYQQEFEKAKMKAICEIHKKQQELNYEEFLRYLFFELDRTNDHYGRQSLSNLEAKDKNEPFVYNITPDNDKEKAEIFERVAIEHIKTNEGNDLGKNGFIRLNEKSMIIGYKSFETLKKQFKERLNQPFADKTRVIEYFNKTYIEPLKETKTSSRLQNIYKALKSGTPENHLHSYYYGYYTDKAKVIELLKLEEYLNSSKSSENTQSEIAKREYISKPCFNPESIEKINAPTLAFFCSLINEIGIDKKEETESAPKYCKRICEKYSFPYTDRVRQNYYGNKTKQTRKVFIEKVLPSLNAEIKSEIQKYLNTKYPPTQNLYA